MLVAVLIGIMISVVVGVSLITTIMSSVDNLTSDNTTPEGVRALVSVLPYIFVAMVLLGAVVWIGGSSSIPSWHHKEKEDRRLGRLAKKKKRLEEARVLDPEIPRIEDSPVVSENPRAGKTGSVGGEFLGHDGTGSGRLRRIFRKVNKEAK